MSKHTTYNKVFSIYGSGKVFKYSLERGIGLIAPVATAATGIGDTSFTANWNAYTGALYYLLDVSTSPTFNTFILQDQQVNTPLTSYLVTGLTQNTTYYYRLRAFVGSSVFEFTINTANTSSGSSNSDQFKLPLITSTGLNCTVYWGDGTSDTITNHLAAAVTHTYPSSGTYTVKITGDLLGWQFNNGGDRLKMLNIAQWGALNISVSAGFRGCSNLTCSATDVPIITGANLFEYFRACFNFNGAIGNWNTQNVTSMSNMFNGATAFNQNIGAWNVSNVTTFSGIFNNANNFNNGGSSDINNWVFSTTSNINMSLMFRQCLFNQPINNWNTQNVTNMSNMFEGATAFNQDISDWNIANVTNFNNFMLNKTFLNYSAANLDNIYNKWSLQSVQPNLSISFGTIKYTASGQAGKNVLTGAPNNWIVVDGGI